MSEWSIWWSALCAAAAINSAAWLVSAHLLRKRQAELPAEVYAVRRQVLVLSALYVLGCGFRSVLPMIDVPRTCLHDTWASRIVVGRSVATVAELAFAAQWALLLREAATRGARGIAPVVAGVLLPVIVAAELASWIAVLTTNNLLHAIENSLWTLDAMLAVAAFVAVRAHVGVTARRFLDAASIGAALYVAFMVSIDVPMYLARWQADLAAGRDYLSLAAGMREVLERCIVTREWAVWREDCVWLSLYFTVAVWASIALAHAPALAPAERGPAVTRS